MVPSHLFHDVNIFYHQEILESGYAFHGGTRIHQRKFKGRVIVVDP